MAPSFLSLQGNFPTLKPLALLRLLVTPRSRLPDLDIASGLPEFKLYLF
jgi:hypothetical protein